LIWAGAISARRSHDEGTSGWLRNTRDILEDRSILKLKTIGQAFSGRDNRLTSLRLALAAAVLVEHAIIVTRMPDIPPPLALNGWSLSYAAVNAFFILSGFLITDSLERRADVFTYAASRALRILPALAALSLTAVFIIGPVVTSLGAADYWTTPQTWLYPVQVLGFLDTEHGPAGIYADLPRAGEFSATLWTLRYEVVAYLAAAVVFFTPIPWGKWSHLLLFAITSTAFLGLALFWVDAPAVIMSAARLSTAFTLGMVVYGWRDHLPLVPVIAGVALPLWFLSGDAAWAELFMNIAIASTLFWIAFARLGGLPTASHIPDWSYGIYIWHYPVMQTVLFFNPSATPLLIGLISLPATVIIAALSWSWVEKPSLAHKAAFGCWLQSIWVRYKTAASTAKGE
tara:strand:- start:20425 stop:21624 length:1200 start_codon:yes stop_codon:yes gene_type:complete